MCNVILVQYRNKPYTQTQQIALTLLSKNEMYELYKFDLA